MRIDRIWDRATVLISQLRIAGVSVSLGQAVAWASSFLSLALLGHGVVVIVTAPARAALFKTRRWALPLCGGMLLSVFTLTGLVENSTDVVGRWVGYGYEQTVLCASVFVWSVVATAVMVLVDRKAAAKKTR